MPSPTQRTMTECKSLDLTAQIVEKFNHFSKTRLDLFGCIDIVAIGIAGPEAGITGIQACAGASHAARRSKALAEPRLRKWLEAGGKFEIWSWAKRGDRGKRKLWTLRRERITVADIETNLAVEKILSSPEPT